MNLSSLKSRFDIIGNHEALDRALEIAVQVAETDLSVLVTGESGVGKEVIPQIIHTHSPRKHSHYIAVNCGAIPEGTIDSELFGHEKGAFTGAFETRKGYFEVADGGTLFLDEVAELPLSTQVRLLRVIQSGEFIKVGSSKVQKTDVRVIAATNIELVRAIELGRFREDLYYRLNSVPITIPPLRQRKGDIHLLFKKFALDFSDKYKMPPIRLSPDAVEVLESYRWPGNVRQLKSLTEQISILEHERSIDAVTLLKYLPEEPINKLPVVSGARGGDTPLDRDVLFQILYQLRQDVDELKRVVSGGEDLKPFSEGSFYSPERTLPESIGGETTVVDYEEESEVEEEEEQVLSIQKMNEELIRRALAKHDGRRKAAAEELGISERTLYRKIKEFDIE